MAATTGTSTARTGEAHAAAPAAAPAPGPWQQVGTDIKAGISGLSVTSRHGNTYRALVVRDNKRPGENRIAQLAYSTDSSGRSPSVRPLAWRGGAEPIDLEALTPVPGTPDEYVAVASRGLVYHLKVSGDAVDVLDLAPLPAIGAGDDFESFTLTARGPGGKLAAVWADRGTGEDRPATLYAAPVSFDAYGTPEFGAVTKAAYRAPYPGGEVRHASDISVTDSGRLLIGSASDAGDDGPFDSAVIDAGRVSFDRSGSVRLSVAKSPDVLMKFKGKKVEAVDCVAGSGIAVLGTDDENAGGAVGAARICD